MEAVEESEEISQELGGRSECASDLYRKTLQEVFGDCELVEKVISVIDIQQSHG